MIGAFARMFRGRVTEIAEDGNAYEVKERADADVENAHAFVDAPPEAFVHDTLEHEGSKLYVIPFMEAFKEWTRKLKDADDDTPEGEENAEADADATSDASGSKARAEATDGSREDTDVAFA